MRNQRMRSTVVLLTCLASIGCATRGPDAARIVTLVKREIPGLILEPVERTKLGSLKLGFARSVARVSGAGVDQELGRYRLVDVASFRVRAFRAGIDHRLVTAVEERFLEKGWTAVSATSESGFATWIATRESGAQLELCLLELGDDYLTVVVSRRARGTAS